MSKKYYLATTGISEIWDLDNKLLLLGPWCLTSKKNKSLLEGKEYTYTLIPSPFKPPYKIKEAADYCHKIYKEMIPQLSKKLNHLHQVDYPERYWQVLIGPWLLHFIEVLYDRYKRIENTLELNTDFYTHVLPLKQCKTATLNTSDFLSVKVNEDYYNLKLFSLVAYDLCPQKIVKVDFLPESEMPLLNKNIKKGVRNFFYACGKMAMYNLMKLIDTFCKSPIVLSDLPHLTPYDMFLLKWELRFKKVSFANFIHHKEVLFENNYSCKFREVLRFEKVSDRFKSFLYRVLPDAIPMCYMENYKFYKDSIKKNVNSAKAVGSSVGWYFNEEFKFFAAEVASKGAKLIDFQHGGGYGLSLAVPVEAISLEKDIFCTWGWNSKKSDKIIPLPNPHLSRLKNSHSLVLDNILFIGTAMPKYYYRFHTCLSPEDMSKYFEDKKIFFQILSAKIRNKILYCPYHYEYGWEEIKTIKKICPECKIVTNGTAVKWMQKVKLVVIDHAATFFIEALTMNIPSVFYWDHEVFLMRSESEPYFELLRKAGILYRDPVSAAQKVNEIWHDVLGWWQKPEVQKAKDGFCYQFARTSKNWRKEWRDFLRAFK